MRKVTASLAFRDGAPLEAEISDVDQAEALLRGQHDVAKLQLVEIDAFVMQGMKKRDQIGQ